MKKTVHSKFYELTIPGRREMLQKWSDLDDETLDALCGIPGLTSVQADGMIENVVGLYSLPLGIARNFIVNGREVLVPDGDRRAVGRGRSILYGQAGGRQRRLYRDIFRTGHDRPDAGARPGRPGCRPNTPSSRTGQTSCRRLPAIDPILQVHRRRPAGILSSGSSKTRPSAHSW